MAPSKHYLEAIAKVKENDFEGAISGFSKAIDENPLDIESYAERAVCYLHLKQYDLSMFDMNKAVELEPNHGYRYSCRAFLKSAMKDYKGAVADYQMAVEIDPKDIVALNNLGIAQENLGYYEKAQENFKKSNELLGYDPDQREIVGDVAVDKADAEEARRKLEEVEKKNKEIEEKTEEVSSKKKRRVMMDVFSKKGEFKQFVRFIGNGFKIKDDKEGES